jgi:putative hydrolase of the HAD superfamily
MSSKYKGILLDIDDTIYDYDQAHLAAMEEVYIVCFEKWNISKSDSERIFGTARKMTNNRLINTAASHNRMLYFQTFCELLNLGALQNTLTLYNLYWDTFLINMNFFPGAFQFIRDFGPKICFVTDLTAQIQHRKLEVLGISNFGCKIVSSEEVGIEKPSSIIFNFALQKLMLKHTEVCMIGDNFTKDIEGALNLGIDVFWKVKKPIINNNSGIISFFDFEQIRNYV